MDKHTIGPFSMRDYIYQISQLLQVDGSSSEIDSASSFLRYFVAHQIPDSEVAEESEVPPLSDLALSALGKLDGIWAVQLFFRTWPYYFHRANSRTGDPLVGFDAVMSEHPPIVKLHPDVDDLFQTYTRQTWAMCLVNIEAVLEGYLFDVFERLDPTLDLGNLPRQAIRLLQKLISDHRTKDGTTIKIDPEAESQLAELNAARHLWAHKNGVVDERYLKQTKEWWDSCPAAWPESKPALSQTRQLSEWYIKSNIYLAKRLIESIDPQVL